MNSLLIRLSYLRSREALAAVLLPAVIVWTWWNKGGELAWGLRLPALVLVAYILVQGSLYWHLKLRAIETGLPLPHWFHRLYRGFQWSNLIAIGAVLAALLLDRRSLTDADIRWTAGLLAGAVLEQINYYHYQLMYDTRAAIGYLLRRRRLRKAALAIDILRSAPKPVRGTPA